MKGKLLHIGTLTMIALFLLASMGGVVLAQESSKQVGIVVRYGDGTEHTEVVSVPADATALDALLEADLEVVTSDFGGGFVGVCRIGPDGCPAEDCFCEDDSWAFWIANGDQAEWDAAQVGADAYTPADEDVIGFSWTGFDANFAPLVEPEMYTFAVLEEGGDADGGAGLGSSTLLVLGVGLVVLAAVVGYVGLRRRRAR